jgi:UDP-galactopyranose mutase
MVPKTLKFLKIGGDIFESSRSSGIYVYLFGSHILTSDDMKCVGMSYAKE